MIKFKSALNIVINSINPLDKEEIEITFALDRLLAQDIYSKDDVPGFDNSAMDGYALRAKDARGASLEEPIVLKVIDDVRAGYVSKKRLSENQAIRIMTGAPLPKGADSVVMVEYTKKIKNPCLAGRQEKSKIKNKEFVEIFREVEPGENIRRAGEDVKKGEKVLSKGSLIRAQEMGILASMGIRSIKVSKKPRIGILATGDELVEISQKLSQGKIRNSNTYCLLGEILKLGAIPVNLGIAKDKPSQVRQKIISGLNKNLDMLLVSGGISVGDYDFVKDVLSELGTKIKIWKVAMRPGKPVVFGSVNGMPIFGLPGNPVSSMIVFEEFVRPAILKMCGARKIFRPVTTAVLYEDFEKKKGLRYFVRVRLENKDNLLYARLTGPQGSGILKSLVLADALMVVPEEISELKKGQKVSVQLLS